MCGIIGIYSPNNEIQAHLLESATAALAHRGPDGQGTWISKDKNVGIGHRRLSIVGIDSGQQPILNTDKTICISVNGEFYDDHLIRDQLKAKNYQFHTHSDSELILNLYKEYGLGFVKHLRGEFSFILYDVKKKKMIAVRDRFGIKPLCYYYKNDGTLYIASEAKAIFAAGITPAWNEYSLYHTLCFQYTPLNQTLFAGANQLPPGYMLIYDGHQLITQRYWDLDYTTYDNNASFDDLCLQLDDQLKDAIKCRLRADENKICCHLSGGIDSATIASLASQLSGKPLPCFSVSFPHEAYNELTIASELAKKLNAAFHPVFVGAEDIVSTISDAVYFSEGLSINSHISAKYILNREIKKAGFNIALSGEGSDELFLGYIHLKQDLESNPLSISNNIANGIHITNDQFLSLDSIKNKLGFVPSFIKAKAAIGYKIHQLLKINNDFTSDQVFDDILANTGILQQINGMSDINKSTYLWVKFALSGYILKTLGDACEMAHGVEGRVPFLDHHLFEFAKTIPTAYKVNKNIEKYILRETVKNYVTPEIYNRQKHPFMAPPLSLLNDRKGFEFINDCLRSKRFSQMPFFDGKKVIDYLDTIPEKSMKEQVASEPVLMMMLTSFLLSERYHL
jgi:asparagine synthase (glutamine-hydrolysing)